MADITRRVRSKNAHDPNHLTFGHLGQPKYNDSTEVWRFLRNVRQPREADDNGRSVERSDLRLLRAQSIPTQRVAAADDEVQLRLPHANRPTSTVHPRQHALRLALNSVPRSDTTDSSPPNHQSASSETVIAFGYASAPYEAAHHRAQVPIVVSANGHEQVVKVNLLKLTKDDDTSNALPTLEDGQATVSAPRKEAVLGLCFSVDKRFLAIRQRSGSSVVIPVLVGTESDEEAVMRPIIRLDHVVTLPRNRTGGHTHADVSFHPHDRTLLGVVDEHGNWSCWKVKGRRSASSRIIYQIIIHSSGKLVPSEDNLKHFNDDIFFDGWHRICCLEPAKDQKALLICSRRLARTYHLDGRVRGDVDMRLGPASASNWVLDVRSSAYRPAVCFILTTARIQIMRMSSGKKGSDELDLLCSWAHFHGRGDLSLTLDLVETSGWTGLFVSSTLTLETWAYWGHWTQENELVSASDPQLVPMPAAWSQMIDAHSRLRFEAVRADVQVASGRRSSSMLLVQLVAMGSDRRLYGAIYELGSALAMKDVPLEAGLSLRMSRTGDRRVQSARVVEEEDELLDFVVPDEVSRAQDLAEQALVPFFRASRALPKTRDWADLVALDVVGRTETTIDDALGQLSTQEHGSNRDVPNVQTLAEVLPEVRIPDIEDATAAISAWQHTHQPAYEDDDVPKASWTNTLSTTGSLLSTYQCVTAQYVTQLSAEVPDRARVQTERLCRNVALDQYASFLTQQRPRQRQDVDSLPSMESLDIRSSPPSSPPPTTPNAGSSPALAALQRYTSISEHYESSLQTTTTKNILAHLPTDGLNDPSEYSYTEVEAQLRRERTQQEHDDLDARARRKAERAATRREKKKAQQEKLRKTVTQQSTMVPGLTLTSPQRDPRAVQSSQLGPVVLGSSQPGLAMTQPERGAHGERRKVGKKEGKRVKGF